MVRFNGCDRSSMSDRTDFGGRSIAVSARAVLDNIASLMVTEVDLSEGERIEVHLFDFESFREAWINACVHNAWWMMLPPSAMVFDDRIEVVSYGTVPFPMSLESFFEGDSRPVNKALFSMFALLGMTEQSGHGVPAIVSRYGREAFDISGNGVTVTIPFAFEPDYVAVRKETSLKALGLDEGRRKVLEYLSRNPEAKLSDVADYAGMSLSNVKKTVSGFKADGMLRNDGTNRRSRWVVLRCGGWALESRISGFSETIRIGFRSPFQECVDGGEHRHQEQDRRESRGGHIERCAVHDRSRRMGDGYVLDGIRQVAGDEQDDRDQISRHEGPHGEPPPVAGSEPSGQEGDERQRDERDRICRGLGYQGQRICPDAGYVAESPQRQDA